MKNTEAQNLQIDAFIVAQCYLRAHGVRGLIAQQRLSYCWTSGRLNLSGIVSKRHDTIITITTAVLAMVCNLGLGLRATEKDSSSIRLHVGRGHALIAKIPPTEGCLTYPPRRVSYDAVHT